MSPRQRVCSQGAAALSRNLAIILSSRINFAESFREIFCQFRLWQCHFRTQGCEVKCCEKKRSSFAAANRCSRSLHLHKITGIYRNYTLRNTNVHKFLITASKAGRFGCRSFRARAVWIFLKQILSPGNKKKRRKKQTVDFFPPLKTSFVRGREILGND